MINMTVTIISQCIYIYQIITLYTLNLYILFVNYISIKLEGKKFNESALQINILIQFKWV